MSIISELLGKYRNLMTKSIHDHNTNSGNIPNEPNLHPVPTKNHDHIHMWIKNTYIITFISSLWKTNTKTYKFNTCQLNNNKYNSQIYQQKIQVTQRKKNKIIFLT